MCTYGHAVTHRVALNLYPFALYRAPSACCSQYQRTSEVYAVWGYEKRTWRQRLWQRHSGLVFSTRTSSWWPHFRQRHKVSPFVEFYFFSVRCFSYFWAYRFPFFLFFVFVVDGFRNFNVQHFFFGYFEVQLVSCPSETVSRFIWSSNRRVPFPKLRLTMPRKGWLVEHAWRSVCYYLPLNQ